MKIGIITFHRAVNYGAILQAYALSRYINDNYGDASIIDYRPRYMQQRYAVFNLKRNLSKNVFRMVGNFLDEFVCIAQRRKRNILFQNFLDEKISLSGMDSRYDIVFLGSDQIWNPVLTGKSIDPVDWGQNITAKKICTYAPSMDTCNMGFDMQVDKYLKSFAAISVRELSLKNFLKLNYDVESTVVCDPVFLHDDSFWANECISGHPTGTPYALLYLVRAPNAVIKKVKEFCRIKKVDLVVISNDSHFNIGNTVIASPAEFLNYIYHAEYVFSTSFHATAFSIIFKKRFNTFALNNANSRVADLLNIVGLSEYLISVEDSINCDKTADYDEAGEKLRELITSSKNYIEKCCCQ